MKKLVNGEYFGEHYHKQQLDNLLITDTVYTHNKVDWHYHENPYFTYLLQGKLYEENKKERYHLKSGGLLFHNWQDAHYNIKPPEFTRGFHIEMKKEWFDVFQINPFNFEGSLQIDNPIIKENIHKIFFETKINDIHSSLTIELLLVDVFSTLKKECSFKKYSIPNWIGKLKELLHYQPETSFSLTDLATALNIHPVHLSRDFPKYFNTTIGNYIRTQKVNKALLLILNSKLSMTQICYECGFYDQSHFTKTFKNVYNQTPLQFSKKLKDVNFIQL